MTKITASDVNKLRILTGESLMDCRKVLTYYNGDFNSAFNYLKAKNNNQNQNNQNSIPDNCPHCKNPNNKRFSFCEWCGGQIC